MFDIFLGIIVNLLVFTVIGIGPALFLLSDEQRIEISLAIAPTMGFTLCSVFGTYLVLLDFPVSKWVVLWLIASSVVSFALCCASKGKIRQGLGSTNWRIVSYFVVGIVLTAVLASTPAIVGGLDFTVLRGNGTDAFNYITLAGYLDHEPLSWVAQVDTQTLVQRHPSYGLAQELLGTRWTTSMMLAWTSQISQVPLYRFEYGFSALSCILTFGPAFCFALLAGVRPGYSFLLALAVCVGFWPQFVIDARAVSQVNSIPVILLLALFFARIEFDRDSIALGERFLLAITIVSLTFLYPEILPMTALAVAIYFGACLCWRHCSLRNTMWHMLSLVIVVLGILPVISYLGRFFSNQMTYAATGQNTWHEAYFGWLYSNPLTGLWGLSHLSHDRPVFIQTIMVLMGLILSLLLIFAVISEFLLMGRRKQILPATLIGISFVLAAVIQFLYLFLQNQLWAGGKGLSFGYPFIVIATGAYGLNICRDWTFRWNVTLQRITKSVIVVWLVIQCGLGISRTGYAYAGRDYRNYIWHHGEYRRHDWGVAAFSNVFDNKKASSLWISAGNTWVSEYLGFVFGWNMNVLNLDGVTRGGRNFSKMSQTPFELPQYLILSRDSYQNFDDIAPFVVAENSELMLVRVSSKLLQKSVWLGIQNPVWLGIQNPNGVETESQGKKFFWMGGGATSIRLFSPADGEVLLKAKYVMGPSLPEKSHREMIISSDAGAQAQHIFVTEAVREIRVPVKQGVNEISLKIADLPSMAKLPNGDTRPLLLGVYGLEIGFERNTFVGKEKKSGM